MILFLTLLVSAAAFDKAGLKAGLQSSEGQLKLFKQWVSNEHASYSAKEQAFRFRVFRKHLSEIVAINDEQDDYELDANFMAGLTEEEQQQWYGINITALPAEASELDDSFQVLSAGPSSGSKLWREEGKITPVKNQGGCGSCWAFAGIASFEGHYAIKTGGLKEFAEQEFLDCTYEGRRDGCKGGWYWEAYDMVKRNQRLALSADYRYTQRDGRCLSSSKPNGMKAAKFAATARPRKSRGDSSLVSALNIGPVAMAFEIKGGFNYYKNGVLTVHNCGRTPHHAMAVTGYTPEFFEIKNSWGSRWGDRGYVRFSRKVENMCGISNWLSHPTLQKTGDDTDDVTPTDGGDGGDCNDGNARCKEWADRGECMDSWQYMGQNCKKSCNICGCSDATNDCVRWKGSGYCDGGSYTGFMNVMCRKSCGKCNDNNSDCPEGLKMCDGVCKHEHFC